MYYERLINIRPSVIIGKHIIETDTRFIFLNVCLLWMFKHEALDDYWKTHNWDCTRSIILNVARWRWVQKALRRYTKMKDFSRRFSNCSSRISHLGNFPLHEIEHENAICMPGSNIDIYFNHRLPQGVLW